MCKYKIRDREVPMSQQRKFPKLGRELNSPISKLIFMSYNLYEASVCGIFIEATFSLISKM